MRWMSTLAAAISGLGLAAFSHAGFTLDRVVVSGGGGPVSGGGFRAILTIGQTLASAPNDSIGGEFKLATGFWAGARSCPADLNSDSVVDDTDFVIFATAYNVLLCSDPSMVAECPADFNADTLVEDADFVVFADAYNALICP